ncbi:MAG: helix-turn-helix transcriptional regulator, partial [Bacilli bacterium]|nr:helix-turn-helix transcriptional regulator [Bacilli bacterium]
MKISERIKKYREENHITQQELADKLYVSKQAISKWENDKSLPDVSMYPTIASLLNITVDELMGNEANKNKLILSKKVIIICSIIVCLILIFIIIMIINPSKISEEKIIINETEKALDIELPKIETYDIIEYNSWVSFNNYMYPHKMYYFIFKDEIIKI